MEAQVKKTLHVNLRWNKYSKEFVYSLDNYPSDPGDDYVTVEVLEVEFATLENQEERRLLHKALMGRRAKVLADAHMEAQEIAEMAQELLALEFKSEKVDDDIPF